MSIRWWPRGMVVALVLSFVVGAASVHAAKTDPSPENSTFWLHIDDSLAMWINADVADPAHTATNGGYNPAGMVVGEETGAFVWNVAERSEREGGFYLDPDGAVNVTVWIGSGTHAGLVAVSVDIMAGSELVATASADPQAFAGPVTGYIEVSMTTTPLVSVVEEPLRLIIRAQGFASSVFLRAEEGRWTSFSLPITDEPPADPEEATTETEDNETGVRPAMGRAAGWTSTPSPVAPAAAVVLALAATVLVVQRLPRRPR